MSLTTGRALRALVAAAVDVRAARADALLFARSAADAPVSDYLAAELDLSVARRRLERFRAEVHVRLPDGAQVPLATAEEWCDAHAPWTWLRAPQELLARIESAYEVPYDELG